MGPEVTRNLPISASHHYNPPHTLQTLTGDLRSWRRWESRGRWPRTTSISQGLVMSLPQRIRGVPGLSLRVRIILRYKSYYSYLSILSYMLVAIKNKSKLIKPLQSTWTLTTTLSDNCKISSLCTGVQLWSVRGAAQRDGLHCPEGEQPEGLAVQDPPLCEAPAIPAVQPEVPHYSVVRPPTQPKPDEMETFQHPGRL